MHPNHVGSPALITDATGTQVITRMMHKPYGEIVRDVQYSSGPDITRKKFTGQEEDAETGLIYFQARYYDPAIGRFITSDSEFGGQGTQGFNRHMYATGNPVKYTDPSGHNAEEVGRWDEKGNERTQETSRSESSWDNAERGGRSESSGVESARESHGESSTREHADVDRGDSSERGAAGASNAIDNSQLNSMINTITATQFSAGSIGGTPLLMAQASPVFTDTPGGQAAARSFQEGGWAALNSNQSNLPAYATAAGVTLGVIAFVILAVKLKSPGAARAAAGQFAKNTAMTVAGTGGPNSNSGSQIVTTIGNVIFKTQHAAPHLTGTGQTANQVEGAIYQAIMKTRGNVTGPFWGRVNVSGKIWEYRAFPRPDGKIDVGTYYRP